MGIKKSKIIFLILGLIASGILGYYLSALLITDGQNSVYTIIERFNMVKENPLRNYWNKYSILVILFVLIFYFVFVLYVLFGQKARRPGEEQGSSRWENPERITRLLSNRSNSITDPYNIVVIKEKKLLSSFIKPLKNVFYKIIYRKAD